MTKIKLNLASGTIQERELVTAFNFNNVKYVIFDGESTGSMGLPIILVGKENFGKIVGITDAEEWKTTKECLKKIIAGEEIEYAYVNSEVKADDIYYRQLTLPIASFDKLKTSYKAPEAKEDAVAPMDNTPIFEQITPEDVAPSAAIQAEPVEPNKFISINNEVPASPIHETPNAPVINPVMPEVQPEISQTKEVSQTNNYDELKKEFLESASKLFDDVFKKFNHND